MIHPDHVEYAAWFEANPIEAHEIIFKHRREFTSCPDQHELLRRLHNVDNDPQYHNVLAKCFREFGKSSLMEEFLILMLVWERTKNAMIIGDSWTMACQRLRSIRRELEDNVLINMIYGDQVGDTWSVDTLVLANNAMVKALGARMPLRGLKHEQWRPSLCLIDDLESRDSVRTPGLRQQTKDWYYKDLEPVNPFMRKLVTMTPLDPDSWGEDASKSGDFSVLTVPIKYVDEYGTVQSSWAEKFTLEKIDEIEKRLRLAGQGDAFASEYMMQAVDPSSKLFTSDNFLFDPNLVRTWQPTIVAYDPARTVNPNSATTGKVVASWIGRRLIVWEASGEKWLPNQLEEDIFRTDKDYEPTVIGIEKDGLSEWVEQPIRLAMLRRQNLIPIRYVKAPRDKNRFISELQPLFSRGEIVFAGPREKFTEAVAQFSSFPNGRIDIPNAFAYLLNEQLHPGLPVYEDAYERHVSDELLLRSGPITLAINSGPTGSTAVLFQYKQLVLTILNSWASGGDAGQSIPSFIQEATLFAGRTLNVIAPPSHYESYNSFGLRAVCRGICELRKGGDVVKGREFIRLLFRSEHAGCPRILIGREASWFRRAVFGGYARIEGMTEPKPSLYSTMVEAVESAAAMINAPNIGQSVQRIEYTADGTPYQSAVVDHRR